MKTNIDASNAGVHRPTPIAGRRNAAALIANDEPSSPPLNRLHGAAAARGRSATANRSAGPAKTPAEASWENEGGALNPAGKPEGGPLRASSRPRPVTRVMPRIIVVLLGLAVVAGLVALGTGSADAEFIAVVLLGLGMIAVLLTIVGRRDRSDG